MIKNNKKVDAPKKQPQTHQQELFANILKLFTRKTASKPIAQPEQHIQVKSETISASLVTTTTCAALPPLKKAASSSTYAQLSKNNFSNYSLKSTSRSTHAPVSKYFRTVQVNKLGIFFSIEYRGGVCGWGGWPRVYLFHFMVLLNILFIFLITDHTGSRLSNWKSN